jgi:hypothetical protein
MDVVYMNEFLKKRRSHGMDYFGKDKKLKSQKYFFSQKKFTYEINTEKCFFGNFFQKCNQTP